MEIGPLRGAFRELGNDMRNLGKNVGEGFKGFLKRGGRKPEPPRSEPARVEVDFFDGAKWRELVREKNRNSIPHEGKSEKFGESVKTFGGDKYSFLVSHVPKEELDIIFAIEEKFVHAIVVDSDSIKSIKIFKSEDDKESSTKKWTYVNNSTDPSMQERVKTIYDRFKRAKELPQEIIEGDLIELQAEIEAVLAASRA